MGAPEERKGIGMNRFNRVAVPVAIVMALGLVFFWMRAALQHNDIQMTVAIHHISPDGVGEKIGVIVAEPDGDGIVLKPDIKGLRPGRHAFHVHENPSCEPGEKDGKTSAGLAAGGHYDPHGAMKSHGHDDHSGHDHSEMEKPAGDLPELVADTDGVARQAVEVKSLAFGQLSGRAIMIHAYGEAPDDPALPKGGGPRIACGVIPG